MNLVRAFQLVHDPDAELWICGSGDSKEAIENADFTFTPYQNGSAFTSATRAVNKEYTLNNILTKSPINKL